MKDPMRSTSLDILLYAHDGRGTGHVSRSVAIGMALRRLHPELRVMLATGSSRVSELVGAAPLDCCKLPSYATRVVNGVSQGVPGPSGFGDKELGRIRERLLADIVAELQPRIVLADHTPQGKHRELLPALQAYAPGTRWILGVRAVVGGVDKVFSSASAQLFHDHYHGLLWYGDSRVLGSEEPERLQAHYGVMPEETGYVCRARELDAWADGIPQENSERLAGVVSLSWGDGNSPRVLEAIAGAVCRRSEKGKWRIYTDMEAAAFVRLGEKVRTACELRPFGREFHSDLCRADMAVVYGGYNSLTDVLARNIPALIMLRGMRDREQERHVELLSRSLGGICALEVGEITEECFCAAMDRVSGVVEDQCLNLDGAANAACLLAAKLKG